MKKGFTLIELLAVLVILGLLIVIAIPTYVTIFNGIRRDALETKITEVETVTLKYGSTIKDEIKSNVCKHISIDNLIKKGLLTSDSKTRNQINNPVTNTPLEGEVLVCYDKNEMDIVANYVTQYKQNKIYYKGDKVNIGFKIYKCLSQINSGNYDINNLSQFELIYSGE